MNNGVILVDVCKYFGWCWEKFSNIIIIDIIKFNCLYY